MTLKEKLIQEGKTRWLDIGYGGNFESEFHYMDIFPESVIDPRVRERYFKADIASAPEELILRIGKFDLVRMQHAFEHLSYREGKEALKNCTKILNKNGYILITAPDLRIYVQRYLSGGYKNWSGFEQWANNEIPQDAPSSFYFSVFAHGMPYERHKWCYDFEGLKYQL